MENGGKPVEAGQDEIVRERQDIIDGDLVDHLFTGVGVRSVEWSRAMTFQEGGDPILVLDISRYQRPMDFAKAKAQGIVAVVARASVGDYYTDPAFDEYYYGAKEAGLAFGAYLVVAPADSYGRRITIDAHLETFESIVGQLAMDLPHTVDSELTRGCTPSQVTYTTRGVCEGIVDLDARKRLPMIYTRASWWNPNIQRSSKWARYKLFVAHYNDQVSEPILPLDWKTWRLWQFSADGNGQGPTYGASSAAIDLDRYNGTKEEFMAEFELTGGEPEPEPEPVSGLKFRVDVPVLNIREGPGTQYRDIGDLAGNDVVTALNVNGADAWIEIEPGKWACVQKGTAQFMTVVKAE